jgi:hypothetical protein
LNSDLRLAAAQLSTLTDSSSAKEARSAFASSTHLRDPGLPVRLKVVALVGRDHHKRLRPLNVLGLAVAHEMKLERGPPPSGGPGAG